MRFLRNIANSNINALWKPEEIGQIREKLCKIAEDEYIELLEIYAECLEDLANDARRLRRQALISQKQGIMNQRKIRA